MSGHSHYAQIHRQKGLNDAKRGNLFSKLARAISIAVKTGGANPDANLKLKVAIEKAHAASMPKDNVERAIAKGEGSSEELTEVSYEGFGPGGVGIIVEAATDNKNRTAQEIKNLFERSGGSLAGPGAVSFNFDAKGYLLVEKNTDLEAQMLSMIDMGAEDVSEVEEGIEVYVEPNKLSETRKKFEEAGFKVVETELVMKPKNLVALSGDTAAKLEKFLDSLWEYDDVQKVFTNADL